MGGYPLAHAMMLMIPEAWADNPLMDAKRRAFYEYHAALMEPWDGPAAMAFTDGKFIGATLDRNGLRPARYVITDDDLIVMSSEMGVLDIPQEKIVKKWRLQPGKMLLVDLEHGRIVADEELKRELAAQRPYQDWLDRTQIRLEDIPMPDDVPDARHRQAPRSPAGLRLHAGRPQDAHGADGGHRARRPSAPWATTRRSRCSPTAPKPLYAYFRQLFAQVTNPPIDPIREQLVMSLVSFIGPRPNLLSPDSTRAGRCASRSRQPILTFEDMEKLRRAAELTHGHFQSEVLSMCYPAEWGAEGMEPALAQLCADAEDAVRGGVNIIILTDRDVSADAHRHPGAARHGRACTSTWCAPGCARARASWSRPAARARCTTSRCLAGFGAEAIHPNLAFATLLDIGDRPAAEDRRQGAASSATSRPSARACSR